MFSFEETIGAPERDIFMVGDKDDPTDASFVGVNEKVSLGSNIFFKGFFKMSFRVAVDVDVEVEVDRGGDKDRDRGLGLEDTNSGEVSSPSGVEMSLQVPTLGKTDSPIDSLIIDHAKG